MLLFVTGTSILTGLLFGLAPAWHAARLGCPARPQGGRPGIAPPMRTMGPQRPARPEVALSLVLLVGAALLLRSFARVTSIDPGFQGEKVLTFRVALPNDDLSQGMQS